MANPNTDCRICTKKVLHHDKIVFYSLCQATSHQTCLNLYSPGDIDYVNDISLNWSCPKCLSENFPFFQIETSIELTSLFTSNLHLDQAMLDQLVFDPFEQNDMGDIHDDIDPDANYFNSDHRSPY